MFQVFLGFSGRAQNGMMFGSSTEQFFGVPWSLWQPSGKKKMELPIRNGQNDQEIHLSER